MATLCKSFQAPPERKDGAWVAYNTKGEEVPAGSWSENLKGWCRYISPKIGAGCPYKDDEKVECPIK
jgi:hypothetical protein